MRVLFVNPLFPFRMQLSPQPPLGQLSLASFLQTYGHTVKIYDRPMSSEKLRNVLRDFQPEAVGITLTDHSQIDDAIEIAESVRAFNSNTAVFWGGHTATIIPEEIVQSGYADCVGLREGEYTMLELLEVVAGKRDYASVKGIVYKEADGNIVYTPPREFADLTEFPMLDFSLIEVKKYFSRYASSKKLFPLYCSKGCPFNCKYCFNEFYHLRCYRMRTIDVIIEEVRTLVEDYGADCIDFMDECFGVNKKWLVAFCTELKKLNLPFVWFCEGRIGQYTEAEMAMMYDSGCRYLLYGLESGSPELLKKINKQIDVDQMLPSFELCKQQGILTTSNVILGLPGQTPKQLLETVRMIFAVNPTLPAANLFRLVPKTDFYNEHLAQGLIQPPQDLLGWRNPDFFEGTRNFSETPFLDMLVVINFFVYCLPFRKRDEPVGRFDFLLQGCQQLWRRLSAQGFVHFFRVLADFVVFFCKTFWYAHAYPKIRKKYDLYTKNFGRTVWDNTAEENTSSAS
jgi:radical SAM superfamily enzyme YgiQ (UPF0313 family)